MHRAFAAAVLLVGIASFLPAQEPEPRKSVTKLIDDLGNQDFKVREAAAKAIEALGPEALPALRKAKDHPDLEVRRRIKEWLPKFEMEAFVVPKRINLDVKNQPLEKVVAELSRQTGYKLELSPGDARAKKPLSVQFAKTTFWEAIDKVCQECGLDVRRGDASPENLLLSSDARTSPYRSYHGAFRVRANGFHYFQQTYLAKDINFAQPPLKIAVLDQLKDRKQVSETFSFQFDLAAEPRLTILSLGEPTLNEAMDDQKRSLLPKKDADDERFGGRGRFAGSSRMHRRFFMAGHDPSATANLLAPAKGARSMKVLRGAVPVYLEKETKRIVLVDNIAKAQGKKYKSEEFTVEFDLFKQTAGNTYHVYFSFTRNKSGGKEDHDSSDDGSFELEDAKGNRYAPHGSSMSGDGKSIEASINFGPPFNVAGQIGPPVRLVYIRSIPLEYHVPFEFKDLPLP